MKKNIIKFIYIFSTAFCLSSFSAESVAAEDSALSATEPASESEAVSEVEKSKAGVSEVPPKKKPVKATAEQIADAEASDPGSYKKNSDVLKFGLESDIINLLDTITSSGDVRFTDDVYDLYTLTRSSSVREKIFLYFAKLKDPCLENFAVSVLNDPYDERKSFVDAVFRYTQAVKTVAAVPAVLSLLESENQDYWEGALTTLGEIGGPKEAVYLTEYLERDDLTTPQKQSLVKVLGKLKAVETYDTLAGLAEDKDENTFVRMYSAEAIGAMQKEEAVPILVKLYEDADPNIRTYAVKGISNFSNEDAQSVVIQAVRDSYYKVRLEAIAAVKKQKIIKAIPYLVYRAQNDSESVVKNACYPAIAELNTKEGNEFLVGMITDKKTADDPKSRAAAALLKFNNAGTDEIIALAKDVLKDDRRKPLRYALGKEFAKYDRHEFVDICKEYISSTDPATQGTGLDIYARGRYSEVTPQVKAIAEYYKQPDEKKIVAGKTITIKKKRNANAEKAAKILGIDLAAEEEKNSEATAKEEEAKKEEAAAVGAESSSVDSAKKNASEEKTSSDAK